MAARRAAGWEWSGRRNGKRRQPEIPVIKLFFGLYRKVGAGATTSLFIEVTCGGNVGHAISVDSNDYDANQFMDVHNNDGSGFWDKVCPTVSPPDICECSWKVVADSNCYDA